MTLSERIAKLEKLTTTVISGGEVRRWEMEHLTDRIEDLKKDVCSLRQRVTFLENHRFALYCLSVAAWFMALVGLFIGASS